MKDETKPLNDEWWCHTFEDKSRQRFFGFFPLYFFGFKLPTGFQQNGISCSVMTLQTHIKVTDTSQQLTEVIHHFLK